MKYSLLFIAALAGANIAAAQENTAANKTSFNPAISLILQGQYADYRRDPEDYNLPGFMLGHEAELAQSGFGLGHNELVMSANVDNYFHGKLTAAIADHEGDTKLELEEAFIETLGLGNGLTVKGGRFMSNLGYLNNQHGHSWDFIDAPLVYRGLFGNQLIDDGVQLRWLAPTDLFLQLGAELGRGERFPAGGASRKGKGSHALFAELGGDFNSSHSWQLGLSHWKADVNNRTGHGHQHQEAHAVEGEHEGEEHEGEEHEEHASHLDDLNASFTGDSRITAFDFVWKWAPEGNSRETSFKWQFEYFVRNENGQIELADEHSSYQGKQKGWYTQAIYKFMPSWRVGLRYDSLKADNQGSDMAVLDEANLDSANHHSRRHSVMLDYAPSEFSVIRLQYNRDLSQPTPDDQVYLQYVMSLGAHGAHQF